MTQDREPNDAPAPPGNEPMPGNEPLRSVHTSNFPEMLRQLHASLLVSTYQAGRLVVLRAEGESLNTHFRTIQKPMGIALSQDRLAVGSAHSIWEFHNLPAVCEKLNSRANTLTGDANAAGPAPQVSAGEGGGAAHDACFLPRTTHWTGDVQIHEMAWVGSGSESELWFVNTRFSCLCRRSGIYSFTPVWRPPFVTSYVPGDCCHLNGLGLRSGAPRYVTALGETDTPGGWRENKRDGGIVMDIESNEVICRSLSMPHSPRWYRDRLWLLESGRGGLGYLDPSTGQYQQVAALPGFTRGLTFAGPLAFIGLSQVRESAVFGGIPIAEQALEERQCGVWVVDIDSGSVVAFLRFEDAVQEIFAVEAVPARYPEIVTDDAELLAGSFELPDDALQDVPSDMRQ